MLACTNSRKRQTLVSNWRVLKGKTLLKRRLKHNAILSVFVNMPVHLSAPYVNSSCKRSVSALKSIGST